MKKILYLAMLLLGLSNVGCQKEPAPIKVSAVVLNSTSLSLLEGETTTLSATVTPSNAENKTVHWSTSNSDVATVNNGTITALKPGTARITATSDDGGKTATCQVEVKSKAVAVESVTLDKTSAELTEGDNLILTATVKPDNATNKNVTWSSSDETVATVSNGKVTAVKAGTAKITVKTEDGAKTAMCAVTVKEKVYPVESVTLDKTSAELTEGDNLILTATVKPDNATNKNVTWSSSDETVATVSNGKVTAVKAGTATITAKADEKTATCNVVIHAQYSIPTVVDLGLSVKWASFNIGASSPEQVGDCFAWGEIYPKTEFTKENYRYSPSQTELDSEHDAATVLLGNNWRMPTKQEVWELEDNCTYEKVEVNGVSLAKLTGPNGNSIYLPIECEYWTSSAEYTFGRFYSPFYMYLCWLTIYHDVPTYHYEVCCSTDFEAYYGHCIRPVYIGTE